MNRPSLQWPKLLGCFVGLEALGIFMCQASFLFWSSNYSNWPDARTTWFWLILATLLSMLAYCLYRAHNWARVIMIILGICLCVLFIWFTIAAEMNWAEMLRRDSSGWDLWRRQIMSGLEDVGRNLALVAPIALIVSVLCHRDVAAAFRSTSHERSNHTMERTADRS